MEKKILKLLKDSEYKTCSGIKCKVVKNNIDLRKENIQLKKQIDLMADKINEAYCNENSFYLWFEKTFGSPDGNYKSKIKQYFEKLVKGEN